MEKEVNISDPKLSGEALEVILNKVFDSHKTDIESWKKDQEAKFEPNVIQIDPSKFVAILDISFMVQDTWDGCNGYYDLQPSDYADVMKALGEEVSNEMDLYQTRQGLTKTYRFQLKINEVPVEHMYQYRIVRAADAEGIGFFVSGLNPLQSLEYRMRRASE